MITQQYMLQGQVPDYLQPLLDATVESYRQRLMDISWFLRELNENIARQANFEDQCTGNTIKGVLPFTLRARFAVPICS